MADTCIHGQTPSACLICATLGRPAGTSPGPVVPASEVPGTGVPVARPAARRGSLVRGAAGVVVAVAVVAVVAWLVLGAVLAALHVIEVAAVAAVAGWVGYRIGHARGSRRQG